MSWAKTVAAPGKQQPKGALQPTSISALMDPYCDTLLTISDNGDAYIPHDSLQTVDLA